LEELTVRNKIPPLITASTASGILEGRNRISFDLGLTEEVVVPDGMRFILPDGTSVSSENLKKVSGKKGDVFFPDDGKLFQVAISGRRFFKLLATAGAPTLEIDGVRMHRTKEVTPDVDAEAKIEALGVEKGKVLDTCTGLGYTAIGALRRGAEMVVSAELMGETLMIAGLNPWSVDLFRDERIGLVLGDVFDIVESLPKGFFDYVVHDPPRFAHAGLLYSSEFYRRLHRVMKPFGKVYHYTGKPGSRFRSIDVRRGVMQRMRQAGFRKLSYDEETMGVVGEREG
jgi:predicted methyltransferase